MQDLAIIRESLAATGELFFTFQEELVPICEEFGTLDTDGGESKSRLEIKTRQQYRPK